MPRIAVVCWPIDLRYSSRRAGFAEIPLRFCFGCTNLLKGPAARARHGRELPMIPQAESSSPSSAIGAGDRWRVRTIEVASEGMALSGRAIRRNSSLAYEHRAIEHGPAPPDLLWCRGSRMESTAPNPVATSEVNAQPRPAPGSRPRPEWTWILLVGMFLGLSRGFRYWRDWQFQALSKESKSSPFPLKDLPKALGEWHSVEGLETKLDPQIARIAGSSDHLIRTYLNQTSGETVVVMVLYGLAELISTHTPAVCYPA